MGWVGLWLLVPVAVDAQSFGDRLKQSLGDAVRRAAEARRGAQGSYRRPFQSPSVNPFDQYRDDEAEPARRIAEARVEDDIFLPARFQDMGRYLAARAQYAHHLGSRCAQQASREASQSGGFRPLPVEEQMRRGEANRQRVAACVAKEQAYLDEPMTRLRAVVTQWAAARPATYDGLHDLSEARAGYRYAWRVSRVDTYEQVVRDRVIALAEPILVQRTDAIEAVLRPQILADAKKPNGADVLERLFVGDQERRRRYTSAIQAADAVAQKAALLRSTDPSTRVAVAATAALERAPRFAAARSMGLMTNEGVRLGIGGPQSFLMEGRNAVCGAPAAGTLPCSYQLRVTYQFMGLSVDSPWMDRRDRFRPTDAAYRSPELDTFMANLADAIGSGRSTSAASPTRDPSKEAREWHVFERRMNDISRGVTPM